MRETSGSHGTPAVRFVRAPHSTDPFHSSRWCRAAAVVLCLPLFACGTDIELLLARDSLLVARADRAAAAGETVAPDLTTKVYDAEDAKRAAGETIYAPIAGYMTTPPSFSEEFASDVGAFIAYIVPIPSVERCAAAQAQYQQAVEALEQRVGGSETDGQ